MTTTAAGRGDQDVLVSSIRGGVRAVVFAGDLPGRPNCRIVTSEDTATGKLTFTSGTSGLFDLSETEGASLIRQVDEITRTARSEGEGQYTVTEYGLFADPESRLHALPISQGPEITPRARWATVQTGGALIREARAQCAALGHTGTLVIYGRADDGFCDPIGKLTADAAGHWQTANPDA